MRKCVLLCIISMSIFACTCRKDKGTVPDLGYGYFPDAVGKYVIYDVDSVIKDQNAGTTIRDTVYKFQIKEVIESVFYDNQNRPTLRVVRYIKNYDPVVPYSSMNWSLKDVWSANLSKTEAEKVEEDVRYVKLIFPVKENAEWNGNAQNYWEPCGEAYQAWDYKVTSAHEKETINGLNFDSVATVLQIDVNNFVDTKYGLEKYAKNVGLVYKQLILLKKQPSGPSDFPPYDDTTVCQQYTMKVISYGN